MLGLGVVPSHAADMKKTLHVAFAVAENGFDPQAVYDTYSFDVCHAIFDPLYTYDYFARPERLVPNTAAAPAEISDGGRTFTVKVRPGIYFADDPAFKGNKRELVAEDYVYTHQAHLRSEGAVVLALHLRASAGRPRRGARGAPARQAASITTRRSRACRHLTVIHCAFASRVPFYAFQHWLTYDGLAAVAREVVETYGDASNRVMEHPVGTGAYRLKEWVRGQKIVLEANPGYRDDDLSGSGRRAANRMMRRLRRPNAGKKLPIIGRVEVSIIEEELPRLLDVR